MERCVLGSRKAMVDFSGRLVTARDRGGTSKIGVFSADGWVS